MGQGLLPLLAAAGDHDIRCFVRSTSRVGLLEDVELAYGDAGNEGSLARALRGVDTFVHIAGIEYSPQFIPAMRRSGVKRLVVISSTSIHSAYEHRSGWRKSMEALVQDSGLAWTIVRPTMIYGSELDKNMHKLLRFLDRSPVFPLFGPGANLWQPVYYKDLAQGIMAALEKPEAVHQSYDLPGAESLTYLDLIRTAASAIGRNPRILRLPLEPVRRMLRLAELARLPLPVESEQIMRLREDKAYLTKRPGGILATRLALFRMV